LRPTADGNWTVALASSQVRGRKFNLAAETDDDAERG
jgi:hypothetical protein